MPFVTVGTENSGSIELYYEDHGSGVPVVLIHGYPLSGRAWEKQEAALLDFGYRVVTYDRRGFGNSSRPSVGYDYDTFAGDLSALLSQLDLRDAVLVGHSMGTGEVVRYLAVNGSARVRKAVLVSPLAPCLRKTDRNPFGFDRSVFGRFMAACRADRPAWMKSFLDDFYNFDVLGGKTVSDQAYQASWNVATSASAIGALACIAAWGTDFRADLPKIDVPVLVIQGDADRILPIDLTGNRLPGLIQDMELVIIAGGPHAIAWTHADRINRLLLDFVQPAASKPRREAVLSASTMV